MKKQWLPATLLTLICLVVINGGYTAVVLGMAQLTPQKGLGQRLRSPDGQLYYTNIAQEFTEDRYFRPRPSAVGYNAAGSGGSNKGPANPEYLQAVAARIDSFLAHNPGVRRDAIPSELVTASGSGLDPDISPAAAGIQVPRIAAARGIPEAAVRRLVADALRNGTLLTGPQTINVLELNLALDGYRPNR